MSRLTRWRQLPRPLLAVGAVVVVALVVAAFWFFGEGPGARFISPRGSAVAEFRGEGDATTDSFQVRRGWQVRWEAGGATFQLAIRGDQNFGTVVSAAEPSSGVTSPPSRGRFHFEVRAEGPWTLTVLQGR